MHLVRSGIDGRHLDNFDSTGWCGGRAIKHEPGREGEILKKGSSARGKDLVEWDRIARIESLTERCSEIVLELRAVKIILHVRRWKIKSPDSYIPAVIEARRFAEGIAVVATAIFCSLYTSEMQALDARGPSLRENKTMLIKKVRFAIDIVRKIPYHCGKLRNVTDSQKPKVPRSTKKRQANRGPKHTVYFEELQRFVAEETEKGMKIQQIIKEALRDRYIKLGKIEA